MASDLSLENENGIQEEKTISDLLKAGDFNTALLVLKGLSQEQIMKLILPIKRTPLHYACQHGRVDVAEELITNFKCSIESKDENGCTPLHIAAQYGQLDALKYMLHLLFSEDPSSLSIKVYSKLSHALMSMYKLRLTERHRDLSSHTPLHAASIHGHLDIVLFLVCEIGCDPVSTNSGGQSCLHLAAQNGHLPVIRYLLEEVGCDMTLVDKHGRSPTYLAAGGGHLNVVKYMIEDKGADPYFKTTREWKNDSFIFAPGRSLVHAASREGHLTVIRYLVEHHGCEPISSTDDGVTPLHLACQRGHMDIVVYFISDLQCDPNCTSSDGMTCLHAASVSGRLDVIKFLINDNHCEIKANGQGDTPLHTAAYSGKLDVVKFFIEDLNCDADIRGQLERIPLHHASVNGHFDVVQYLVDTCHCNPQWPDKNLENSLLLASANGHLDVVRYFITVHHCNPLVKNAYSNTQLHLAALNGKLAMVKFFIEDLHCDANIRGQMGSIPLHRASENGHLDVVRYLVDTYQCDPLCQDENRVTPLHLAISNGHLEVVRYFNNVHHCNQLVKKAYINAPLHFASLCGKLDVVKFFIEDLNCNANNMDQKGRIPLHHASENGHLDVVHYLVNTHYCNPLYQGENKITPLHLASTNGHLQVVKYLLLCGLSPMDTKSLKVLSNAASKNGHTHIASFLDETLINMPIKIFVVGDSGSGKSTLVKSLTEENHFFGRYRTVSGVQPLTPGIFPTAFQSKVFGAVNIYDFAGHKEYYSSHEVILHYASQSIVLIAVNTSLSEVEVKKQLLYWLSLTCSSVKTTSHKIHVIIIGSHADKMKSIAKKKIRGLIDSLLSTQTSISYLGFIHCDCRYSVSTKMTTLRQKLESACIFKRQSIILGESDFSIQLCRSLKHYLQHNLSEVTVITMSELRKQLLQHEASQELIQLTNQNILFQTCEKLSSHGHLLFLLHNRNLEESLLILNESIVLSKVHASIGALRKNMTNDIGMFKERELEESIRSSLLKDVMDPPHLAIKYLTFTQVCTEIDPAQLINIPHAVRGVTHYFFPNLVCAERPTDLWITGNIHLYTLCLECTNTHQFFTPRYLHTLFIQLVKCESALEDAGYMIWKNGILLVHGNGTRCVIEMTDEVIYLTMQCAKDCELYLVEQRSMLISLMKSLKNRICPHLEVKEFLLYPQSSYPPVINTKISLDKIASSVRSGFPYVVCGDEKLEQVKVSTLLVFDSFCELKKSTFQEIFSKSDQIISPDMVKVLCESRLGEVFRQKERLREFTYNQLYEELLKYTIFTDENPYVS